MNTKLKSLDGGDEAIVEGEILPAPARPGNEVAMPTAALAPEPAPISRRGRVYVIDDDDAIVRAVSRLLSPEHDVLSQTSPAAALAHLTCSDDYDLVLCDVTMPQMDGFELYCALEAVRPALAGKMVFMTGGALSPATEVRMATARVGTIAKPFTPQWLRAFVRDYLSQGSPPT